jgi:hypothetical protein
VGVNREELKRMIDYIPEQDVAEVFDFLGKLNLKREREDAQGIDLKALSEDHDLIRQVQKSREDRKVGRVYDQQTGLDYLRLKVEEFERGQNL